MLAKQKTQEFYRALGAEDAQQGNASRSLPGITPCWVELYTRSYQQTLAQPQDKDEDQDIPF